MAEKLTIEIIPEDAERQKGYFKCNSCLMATALKRLYPNEKVMADGHTFFIGKQRYKFNDDAIQAHYIDEAMEKAVVKKAFKVLATAQV